MVLPWVLIGLGCWFGYQLLRQNGRILLRLEAIEKLLASQKGGGTAGGSPPGLPVGSAAPPFELSDLSGERLALAKFRGRKVLLIFFNPRCGFCTKMAPDLAGLPVDGSNGRPLPLVVTTGDAEANRRLVEQYGMRCPVLLQEKMEVGSLYKASGTPMGYLIDEQGNIASDLMVGAAVLLAVASDPSKAPRQTAVAREHQEKGGGKGKANKGLEASRINRSGLKAGTPAPAFRLPRLDGGDLSLADYHGRRLLLVFSDPECGPCDQLAPHLEHLHRHRPDLQVLMVSRRDEEANHRKVARLGLTFPVALQKSWEISRLYGMFATPIAYLIDEQGVIAADVATGVEPIRELVSGVPV
jgi:peroxiredoxin